MPGDREGGHIAPHACRPEGVTVFALLLLTACATTRIVDGFLVDEVRGYKIPILRNGWQRLKAEGVEIAFRAVPEGQIAALAVSCEGEETPPLRILARRLFFGMAAKRILAQEPASLNGTEAIHTLLEGHVGDGDVMVSSYVAKEAGCVYDLVYVATPSSFQERIGEFEHFARGWVFTGTRGR